MMRFELRQLGLPTAMLGLGLWVGRRLSHPIVRKDLVSAELERERMRLRDVVEGLGDVFYALDRDWRFTLVNAAAERFVRRERENGIGQVIWEVFPALIGTEFETRLRRVAATGEPETFEAASTLRPGAWVESRVFPTPEGVAVWLRDLTDRRRAEAALRHSEERRALAMEAADIGSWDFDLLTGALVWDDRCKALFGMPPEVDPTPEFWNESLHPADSDRVASLVARALDPAGDGRYEAEFRVRGLDGVERSICATGKVLFEAGRAVRFIGTAIDVSERKRAEAALRESEERRALAMEVADIGAWEYDPEARVLTGDARAMSMLGLAPEDKAPFQTWADRVHPDDRAEAEAAVAAALDPAGDGELHAEVRMISPVDGRERWISEIGKTVFEAGRARRLIGTVVDVTERKQAEQHRELLVNELNHRVKNSLATVQAIARQTLKSEADPVEARASFTARIIALARAHDVLTRRSWEGAQLGEVVDAAVRPYCLDDPGRVRRDGPRLELSTKAALALSMALFELASNAAKYGALSVEGGGVELTWRIEEERFRLTWRERGGPPVTAPRRRGFGSRLIEQGLAGELGGEASLVYAPEGVVCTLDAPMSAIMGARR